MIGLTREEIYHYGRFFKFREFRELKEPSMASIKPKRTLKAQSVRERANQTDKPRGPRRLRKTAGHVRRGLKAVARTGHKEFNPLKMPDNKVGRVLSKRRSVLPKWLRNAWAEMREVVWPTRKETLKLTLAVFVFAIVFGLLIALVDYGLDKVFRSLLLS